MRISPARLPRLLGVAVIAFAQFEKRPLLGAVELFRGLSIQIAYGWATGRIFAGEDDRAVLLWHGKRSSNWRSAPRELFGIAIATLILVVQLIATSATLLVPVAIVLLLTDSSDREVVLVILTALVISLLMTSVRAISSYRQERELVALLPDPSAPRIHIDRLAALPARNGHGSRLLSDFLDLADLEGAEVALHCDRRNLSFYRRHGFRACAPHQPGKQRVMLRAAPRTIAPIEATTVTAGSHWVQRCGSATGVKPASASGGVSEGGLVDERHAISLTRTVSVAV